MLLAEPQPTQYDLNFVLGGVPVRVHPLFWIISAVMGAQGSPPGLLVLTWIGVVFVSILVHEFGHALAFRAHGYQCHIVLYSMGGLAVPDSSGRRTTWSSVMISLAGPFAGFFLACVLLLGLKIGGVPIHFEFGWPYLVDASAYIPDNRNLSFLVNNLLYVNIFWGIFNLLPVYPLDGGQVSQAVLTHVNPRDGMRQSLMLSIAVAVGISLMGFQRRDTFLGLMFGYLAFMNYQTLQSFTGYGGRRW